MRLLKVTLATLAAMSALTTVKSIAPAAAGGIQDRYCLQGRQWGYPGNRQFSSYPLCMATASGTHSIAASTPDMRSLANGPEAINTGIERSVPQ